VRPSGQGGLDFPGAAAGIAKAISSGAKTPSYFYLTAASRDYGLTEGTRDSQVIKLTDLGRQAVYPSSDEELAQAKVKAFLNIEKFGQVAKHFTAARSLTVSSCATPCRRNSNALKQNTSWHNRI
jgi:hypothetical protein